MAKKRKAKRSHKKRSTKARRPKSVMLRNFTGRVSQNRDKTIDIRGVSMRRRGKAKRR